MRDILTSGHRAYGLYEHVNDYSYTEAESLGNSQSSGPSLAIVPPF